MGCKIIDYPCFKWVMVFHIKGLGFNLNMSGIAKKTFKTKLAVFIKLNWIYKTEFCILTPSDNHLNFKLANHSLINESPMCFVSNSL